VGIDLRQVSHSILALVWVSLSIFGCLVLTASAQTDTPIWRDDMNYQTLEQLLSAGWTTEHPDGVSFGSNGPILDQTNGDTSIHYIGHFAAGIYDWKVEDQSRWVSGDHCGNVVSALTEKHSYGFSADGWYSNFVFYHDGAKVYQSDKGTFSESKGVPFTLSMIKSGNQINCYYNGQLEYTYTEKDSSPAQLTGVDAVSPWRGASEYDYFQLSSVSASSSSGTFQWDSILSNPLAIGGIIGGVGAGVGVTVYFVFFAGSSAAASAGSAGAGGAGAVGGSAGSAGSGGSGGGELIHHPSGVQNTQANTLGTGERPPIISGTSELHSGEMLVASADKPTVLPDQINFHPENQQIHSQQSDMQILLNNQLNIHAEQNAGKTDLNKIHQNLQDQVIKIEQDINKTKIDTQNKLHQQTNQILQGSNEPSGEVADSGGESAGSGDA
jgi:hypothetical protein